MGTEGTVGMQTAGILSAGTFHEVRGCGPRALRTHGGDIWLLPKVIVHTVLPLTSSVEGPGLGF